MARATNEELDYCSAMACLAVIFYIPTNLGASVLVVDTPRLTLLTTNPTLISMPKLAGVEAGAHISCGPLASTSRNLETA